MHDRLEHLPKSGNRFSDKKCVKTKRLEILSYSKKSKSTLAHICMLVGLLLFSPIPSHANTDVERGLKAALKFCVRCHVVAENEFVGISSTLSFYMMSEHIDRYEVRLQSVTARHPHIALNLDLTPEIIDDLIAYIKQLDWKARWKRIRPRK